MPVTLHVAGLLQACSSVELYANAELPGGLLIGTQDGDETTIRAVIAFPVSKLVGKTAFDWHSIMHRRTKHALAAGHMPGTKCVGVWVSHSASVPEESLIRGLLQLEDVPLVLGVDLALFQSPFPFNPENAATLLNDPSYRAWGRTQETPNDQLADFDETPGGVVPAQLPASVPVAVPFANATADGSFEVAKTMLPRDPCAPLYSLVVPQITGIAATPHQEDVLSSSGYGRMPWDLGAEGDIEGRQSTKTAVKKGSSTAAPLYHYLALEVRRKEAAKETPAEAPVPEKSRVNPRARAFAQRSLAGSRAAAAQSSGSSLYSKLQPFLKVWRFSEGNLKREEIKALITDNESAMALSSVFSHELSPQIGTTPVTFRKLLHLRPAAEVADLFQVIDNARLEGASRFLSQAQTYADHPGAAGQAVRETLALLDNWEAANAELSQPFVPDTAQGAAALCALDCLTSSRLLAAEAPDVRLSFGRVTADLTAGPLHSNRSRRAAFEGGLAASAAHDWGLGGGAYMTAEPARRRTRRSAL